MHSKRAARPAKPGPPIPGASAGGAAGASPPSGEGGGLEAGANFAMVLAYDGSQFQGWQVQPHGPTVQGKLEEVLRIVTGGPVKLHGSGRTDAGVHALNQVASFTAAASLNLHKLRQSLNGLAAPAIAVKRVIRVSEGFHARHSAIGKTYRYHLFNRPYPPVFAKQRCWWFRAPLNVEAMAAAAGALRGTHDFSAFRAANCAAASPVRSLRRVDITEVDAADRTLTIEMEASGFLQHMARIITGTLTAVGSGRLAPERVGEILAGRDRQDAEITAPGKGLHLVRVEYDLREFPELAELDAGEEA